MSYSYMTAPQARLELNRYRKSKGLSIYLIDRRPTWENIKTMAQSTIKSALWSDNDLIRICQIEAIAKQKYKKYLNHRY